MRLLMSTAKDPKYLAHQYFKYIEHKLGESHVKGFYHNDLFNLYYNKHIVNKVIYKIFPSLIERKIFKNLVDLCESFKPTVVLIFKGMELTPKVFEYLKNKNIVLVNYNLDHPFEYFSKGSGNKNVLNSLVFYNLHITYSNKIKRDLERKFKDIHVNILPFGYALSNDLFKNILEDYEETLRICFIGNPDNERIAFVKSFLDAGHKLDIYGEGWKKTDLVHKNLNIFDAVYNKDYWKTLRRYRVQLNVFRPHNFNSHNMRSFEVPAIGGIMLGPFSAEHIDFFENGKEAFFYKSTEEAILLAEKIMALPLHEAQRIREHARLRSLNSGYSYRERASQLIEFIKQEINE